MAKKADRLFTKKQSLALQKKYKGKHFIFHSPFRNTSGWEDGDKGVLVKLHHYL